MPDAILDLKLDFNPAQLKKLNHISGNMSHIVDKYWRREIGPPICDVVAVQLEKNVKQMIPAGSSGFPELAPTTLKIREAQGMGGGRTRPLKVTGEGSEQKNWQKDIGKTFARVYNKAKTKTGFPYLQAHAEGFKITVTKKMIAYFAAAFPSVAFFPDQLEKLGGEDGSAGGRIAAALRGYRRFPPTKKDHIRVPPRNFYQVTDQMQRQAQAALQRAVGAILKRLTR